MPTTAQLKTIHMAKRWLEKQDRLTEQSYRMLLANVGNVDSSTDLDNAGVEDVMAVMEDLGFDRHPNGPTYWRDKVATRGTRSGERMEHKIRQLHAAGGGTGGVRYSIESLCRQFSAQRTGLVGELRPREAWKLIEMLKAVVVREEKKPAERKGSTPSPSLFAAGPA